MTPFPSRSPCLQVSMSRDKGQAREKTQSTGNGTCSGFSLIYDRCDLPPSPALFRPFASSHQPATHLHRPASRPRHPGKAIHPTHHLSDSASALLPCVTRRYLSTTTQYPSLPKQQLSYRSSLQPHRAPVWALCSEHQARLAGKPPRGRGVPSARPKFASRVCTVPPTDQIAVYWVPTPFSRPASCVSASEPEIGPVLGSSQRVRRLSRRLRMIGCCTLLPTRPQKHTASLLGLEGCYPSASFHWERYCSGRDTTASLLFAVPSSERFDRRIVAFPETSAALLTLFRLPSIGCRHHKRFVLPVLSPSLALPPLPQPCSNLAPSRCSRSQQSNPPATFFTQRSLPTTNHPTNHNGPPIHLVKHAELCPVVDAAVAHQQDCAPGAGTNQGALDRRLPQRLHASGRGGKTSPDGGAHAGL